MKTKDFDCVEMKRRGADALYQKLKDMTPEEQLAFWKTGTEELRRRQQKGKRCNRNSMHSPHEQA